MKVKKAEVNHDNIILDQETPPKAKQGTSVEYGMRRLAKEASKNTPDSDKATAMKALLLFDEAKRHGAGGANNQTGSNQHIKRAKNVVNVDNIHIDQQARPDGTSAAAGLRKLQKHASEGKEDAVREIAGGGRVGGEPSNRRRGS